MNDVMHSTPPATPTATLTVDADPVRPGVQILSDVWRVEFAGRSRNVFMYVDAIAEKWARILGAGLFVSQYGYQPEIGIVRPATEVEMLEEIQNIDALREGGGTVGDYRLQLYWVLRDRTATPAAAGLHTAVPAAPPLEFPDRYRTDWQRGHYFFRNLGWLFLWWLPMSILPMSLAVAYLIGAGGWSEPIMWWGVPMWLGVAAAVASSIVEPTSRVKVKTVAAPVLLTAAWLAGRVAGFVGFTEADTWYGTYWANVDTAVQYVGAPVGSLAAVWFLAWVVTTQEELFARFQMYPDRGGRLTRDA